MYTVVHWDALDVMSKWVLFIYQFREQNEEQKNIFDLEYSFICIFEYYEVNNILLLSQGW